MTNDPAEEYPGLKPEKSHDNGQSGALGLATGSAPLTWGVDGYGVRHYLCARCEEVFGPVDPDTITHKCTKAYAR